jgi:hypothetical protein
VRSVRSGKLEGRRFLIEVLVGLLFLFPALASESGQAKSRAEAEEEEGGEAETLAGETEKAGERRRTEEKQRM